MSLFQRMLASLGIGSAQVNTMLEKKRYAPGEEVRGMVHIRGGQTEQKIDTVYLYLMTRYMKEKDDKKVKMDGVIDTYALTDPFTVRPNELLEIPFAFRLPQTTPLSMGGTPVWLKTGLDVKMAVDPTDNDLIEVIPNAMMSTIFQALNELGFRLRKASCEYAPRLGRGVPFVHEFEFVPTSMFRGRLDELEVIFYPAEDELELFLQIDRKARGLASLLAEALDLDERFVRVRFNERELREGVPYIAERFTELIGRYA